MSEIRGHFTVKLLEHLTFIKFIKLNSVQEEMEKRLDSCFNRVKKIALQNQNINFAFVTLDTVVATMVHIIIFVYGGIKILNNSFTVGEFTIFFSYFGMMTSSLKYFINLSKSYQEVAVSYDRLQKICVEKEESTGEENIYGIKQIEVKEVSFSYGKEPLLVKIDMCMEIGNIYCFYGKNGSGKSTLLSLICGLYIDEFQGEILYDKRNIKDLNMYDVRKKYIGYAEQEPELLLGSIKYNLYLDENVVEVDDKMEYLVDILGLNDYFSRLSAGIESEINDTNNNLSGGEKQKLALLRVLLKSPQVLALDEPTSAMDVGSSEKFMKYLQEIKKEKVIIIVSHDDVVREASDKIFYF